MTQETFKWDSPSDRNTYARTKKMQTEINDTIKLGGETNDGTTKYAESDVMQTRSNIKVKLTQRATQQLIEQYIKSCETGSGKISYDEGQTYDSTSELKMNELKKQKDEVMRIAKRLSQESDDVSDDEKPQTYIQEKRGVRFYTKS